MIESWFGRVEKDQGNQDYQMTNIDFGEMRITIQEQDCLLLGKQEKRIYQWSVEGPLQNCHLYS